ncbi:MAG: universal stress protein [Dehalococcoidia bacterium]
MAEQGIGLVPLDGSGTAEQVLPWARTMAEKLGMRLVFLEMVREAWPGGNEKAEAALKAAMNYLNGVKATQPATVPIELRALPSQEDVATGIAAAAAEMDADMILIATHGRSGPRRWVMGSVAEDVVRSAACAVFVVRGETATPPSGDRTVRRVLVTLDGSVTAEVALEQARRIADAYGATLDLLQVVPWSAMMYAAPTEIYLPEGLDEQLEKGADDYLRGVQERLPAGVISERHVIRGSAADGIIDHAQDTGADLVVMSTHGRSGIARWALGSVAERVLRAGPRPVLLVRSVEE